MRGIRASLAAILTVSACCTVPSPAPAAGAAGAADWEDAFVVTGARVFDGEPVREDAAVLVRAGRIAAVGSAAAAPPLFRASTVRVPRSSPD